MQNYNINIIFFNYFGLVNRCVNYIYGVFIFFYFFDNNEQKEEKFFIKSGVMFYQLMIQLQMLNLY